MASKHWDNAGDDLVRDSAAGDALSGTFSTGRRLDAAQKEAELAQNERAIRSYLVATLHEQSSPLGALLAGLTVAQDDLKQVLSEEARAGTRTLSALQTLSQDLDDALGLVQRLRKIGESLKRLVAKDEICAFDLRDIVPLAAAVAGCYDVPRIPVRHAFEEESGLRAPSWTIPLHGIRFTCALAEVVRELVQTSDAVVQSVLLRGRSTTEGISLAVELQHRGDPLGEAAAFDTEAIELSSVVQMLLRRTNLKVAARDRKTGGGVTLEPIQRALSVAKR